MANEELYTPVNPSPELYTPVDMNFGGVEQQMPSAADIAAASPQPIADKFLKYNKGDATPPRMLLTDYTPSEQQPLPDNIPMPSGKPQPPELYTPAALPQTPDQQEMYTPAESPPDPNHPAFLSDPGGWVGSKIIDAGNWVGDQFKTAGQGLYDAPVATAGSIADKTGTGLVSFLTQFGSEILPIISPTSVIQDVIHNPDSFLADLRTKAGKQGDSVAEYVRKTLYDYTAMQSGISKAEADKSYVAAKDMPANAGGEAGAQIAAMVATKGIAPIASYLEQQTKEAFGPNAGALVGMLGDTLMMGQGAQGKGPAIDLKNIERITRIKELNDAYAQERTKAMGTIVDQIVPPADGSYTSDRGLNPADEQKAMLAEAPESAPSKLPSELGTTPVPEGKTKLYHQFSDPSLVDPITAGGLKAGEVDHAGNPASVYASSQPFYGTGNGKYTAEIHVDSDRVGANNTIKGDVSPEDIVALHEPWHDLARKIEADPTLVQRTIQGDFDHLPAEDQPAIQYIKDRQNKGNTSHNLKEHLDVVASNPDAAPWQRTLAESYRNLSDTLGLDQIPVYGKSGKDASHYDRGTDSITIAQDHPDLNHQILHEANHAINSAAIDFWEKVKDDPAQMEKLAPHEQELMGRVSDINDVLRSSEKDWNDQHPGQKMFNDQGSYPAELHGFKDLHEFMTDVLSRPEFQRTLRNLTGSKETMDRLTQKRGGSPIRNMFQAAYRAIKELFIPGESTMGERNYLSTAYDHVTGLTENMTAEMRTKGRSFEAKGSALKDKLDASQKDTNTRLRAAEVYQDAHIMRNLLRQAATFDEFKTRMLAQHTDPHWEKYVEANAQKWWDPTNRNKLIRVIGEDLDYRKLSRIDQQTGMDPRSVDEFIPQVMEDSGISKLTPAHEKSLLGDEGYIIMPASILKSMKKDTLAGRVQAFFIDKTRDYEILGEQLRHEAKQKMAKFDALKQTDKDKSMSVSSYYDNNLTGRNELINAGLQWPTKEMLEAKGVEPHIIEAYLDQTEMVDKMMSLINQSLSKKGYDPIKPIPGFMPHVHEGAYKVFIEMTDPSGGKSTVRVKGFWTRPGANAYARSLEAGKWDQNGITFRPSPDPTTGENFRLQKPEIIEDSLIENLQDHLKANANFMSLDPSIRAFMDHMETQTMQGMLKSTLERSDVGGYLGEHGPIDGIMAKYGMSSTNLRISKLYDKFSKAVIEDYKNAMFQKEVFEPMLNAQHVGDMEHGSYYGPFTEAVRTTTKYFREMGTNFMNQNVNHLKVIDQDVSMTLADQLGLDPQLINKAGDALRNYISITALRGNVMFYVSNVIQPGMAMMILHYINEERRNAGATNIPHTLVTLTKVLKDRFEPSPKLQAGLQWARENHVVDPLLDLQMVAPTKGSLGDKINSATGGKLNPYIEGIGKETVFMYAYQHMLDSGLTVEDARTVAAQVVDLAMVNYSKRTRALMYQNYGILGKMISPFATFAQAYIGLMAIFGKQMAQNPLKLRSYKVLGSVMAFYWATAGISGMPGLNVYDGVSNILSDWFPEWRIPSLQGLLMSAKVPQWMQIAGLSDGNGHMPEWMRRGPLNASTRLLPGTPGGVYASAPFGAPQLGGGVSSAALPILEAALDGVKLLGKSVLASMNLTDPVTKQDIYKGVMPLTPQPLRAVGMYLAQPGPPILKQIQNLDFHNSTDVVGTTRSTQGEYRMKGSDWRSLALYGRPSLDYQNNADKERNVKVLDKQDQVAKKNLVQIGVDAEIRGDTASAKVDAAVKSALERNYFDHAEEYYKAVSDAIIGQKRTARELDAEKSDADLAARNRMTWRYKMDAPNEP